MELFRSTNIDWLGKKWYFLGFSLIFSVAGILSLVFWHHLPLGVDFKGGIQMEVTTSCPADLAALRAGLQDLGLGEIALQEVGSPANVLLRAERQAGGDDAQTRAVEQIRAKLADIAPGSRVERSEVVGPMWGGFLTPR